MKSTQPLLRLFLLILLPKCVLTFANTFSHVPPGWEAIELPGNCNFYHCKGFEFPPAATAECPVTGATPGGKKCQKSVLTA
jgi:hypothetical protein